MMVEVGSSNRHFRLRSKLFVPGNRPDYFSKALASGADAVCFDLEDSVPLAQKASARANLSEFMRAKVLKEPAVLVRVNGFHSQFFVDDISAVTRSGVEIIVIPKVEEPSEIHETAAALLRLEEHHGIPRAVALLPTIESARGLRQAYWIAAADGRVAGLQLGMVDLFSSLGVTSGDTVTAHYVRMQLRFASGEANVPCFDSAFPDFADAQGFAAAAAAARGLGFSGKSCIHPNQVAAANLIFSPSADEIAEARQIVDKAREAAADGRGSFAMEGHMIDLAVIRRAEEILLSCGELPDKDSAN